MAGIPWEPDLADVLEAGISSMSGDILTAADDGPNHAEETVQALLMLNDSSEGDTATESDKNLSENRQVVDTENFEQKNVKYENISSIQEQQISDTFLAVDQDNMATSVPVPVVAVLTSEEVEPYQTNPDVPELSLTQGVQDVRDISGAANFVTICDETKNAEQNCEVINVLHSTLGQEGEKADEYSENNYLQITEFPNENSEQINVLHSTLGQEEDQIDEYSEKNDIQPEFPNKISEQINVLHSTQEQEVDIVDAYSENNDIQPTEFPNELERGQILGGQKSMDICQDQDNVDIYVPCELKEQNIKEVKAAGSQQEAALEDNLASKILAKDVQLENSFGSATFQKIIDTSLSRSLEPLLGIDSPDLTAAPTADPDMNPTDIELKDIDISDVDKILSDTSVQDYEGPPDTLTTVNCTVEEAFLASVSADPEDAEVASLTTGASGQYVVYDGDGSQYIISESPHDQCVVTESLSLEDQMRALHGPSPEPKTPTSFFPDAVPDLLSLVVQETIPLRLDLTTGEMVPDVEAGKGLVPTQSGAWVTPRQEEVFNIISESLEVFPQDDVKLTFRSPLKKSGSESSAKKGSNVATVKPFNSTNSPKSSKSSQPPKLSNSPIKLKARLRHPSPSTNPRPPSSVKCQCARHMVIGYPPAKVFYWTIGTTPGVISTYMDFDNKGVKFLYDQGDLKSFKAVLSSFKPEFLSTEKSLEVSLCLSCVRWAENEFKSIKEKQIVEIEKIKEEEEKAKELEAVKKEKSKKLEAAKKEKSKKLKAAKKEAASMDSSSDESDTTYKRKYKCVLCKKLLLSPLEFKIHVKEIHQKNASSPPESKRSSTSSKCKCLSHIDIFHGYSFMEQSPVTFRMNFSKTEETSVALRFYKENSMLADSDSADLLCSFCVHFANQQVDKTRSKSPTKKITSTKKGSLPPSKFKSRKQESSSSESSSSSSDSSSSGSDSEDDTEDGTCDVPGCNAVLRSPAALAMHMKSKHPGFNKKSMKKFKSGVIKPVRVDLKKLSKEEIESMTTRLPTEEQFKENASKIVPDVTNVENTSDSLVEHGQAEVSLSELNSLSPEVQEVCASSDTADDVTISDKGTSEDELSEEITVLHSTLEGQGGGKPEEEIDTNPNEISMDSPVDISTTEVSIKNPVDELAENKPKEEEKLPVLSARKRKALDALKINMVSDTFSPGVSRRGRTSRNEDDLDQTENKGSGKDAKLAVSAKKSPLSRGTMKGYVYVQVEESVVERTKSPSTSPTRSGVSRRGRTISNEEHLDEAENKNSGKDAKSAVSAKKSPLTRGTRKSGDIIVQDEESIIERTKSPSTSPTRSGVSRSGRARSNEEDLDETENKNSGKDAKLAVSDEESVVERTKSPSKSPTRSGKKLLKQLKMDLVGDSVTPTRTRRKEVLEEPSGKTGNKLLDQLKMDMVVDSVLPTRGNKRRFENDPRMMRRSDNNDQKGAKKIKIAPVEQVPVKQKGFAAKIFRSIQKGQISKSEGHNVLEKRIPGLTHVGFGKEFSKWGRENPPTEVEVVEPDDQNNKVEVQEEKTPVPDSPKSVSIRLVNVLSAKANLVDKKLEDTFGDVSEKGNETGVVVEIKEKYKSDRLRNSPGEQVGTLAKLQSMKDSLVEILSTGDLKDEEKTLLKEIKELIEIE
eukprot:GFUD01008497.1.p1 GENE.GFUD01008497.1~~GFUD01008497.1.p1  ORF type:complete len:1644 (+),score=506.46 GFUD01008497.1:41-4972(+)